MTRHGYTGAETTGFVSRAGDHLEGPIDLSQVLDLRRPHRYPVRVLISPRIDAAQIARLGVATAPPPQVGPFTSRQAAYLAFHRANVFLQDH